MDHFRSKLFVRMMIVFVALDASECTWVVSLQPVFAVSSVVGKQVDNVRSRARVHDVPCHKAVSSVVSPHVFCLAERPSWWYVPISSSANWRRKARLVLLVGEWWWVPMHISIRNDYVLCWAPPLLCQHHPSTDCILQCMVLSPVQQWDERPWTALSDTVTVTLPFCLVIEFTMIIMIFLRSVDL